jgi:hypothetical protein
VVTSNKNTATTQLPPFVKSVVGMVRLNSTRAPGFGGGESVLSSSVGFEDETGNKDTPVWWDPSAVVTAQEPPPSLPVLEAADIPLPEGDSKQQQQQQQQQHNNTIVISSNNSSILTLPLSATALTSPFFTLDKQGATPLINSTPVDNVGDTSNNRNPNPMDLKHREEEERMIRKKRALWVAKQEIAETTAAIVLPQLLSKLDEVLAQQNYQQQQQQQQQQLYNNNNTHHHYQWQQMQQHQHQQQYEPNYTNTSYTTAARIPPARLPGNYMIFLCFPKKGVSEREGGGRKGGEKIQNVLKRVHIVIDKK